MIEVVALIFGMERYKIALDGFVSVGKKRIRRFDLAISQERYIVFGERPIHDC